MYLYRAPKWSNSVGFRGMAAGWVSEAWPLGGFKRHGHWVGFRGIAAGWITGWVSEA